METVDILSSNAEESAVVIANIVDQKNQEEGFSEAFKNKSKMFKERNILTVEEAADEMVTTHMSRRALRKRITGLNKLGGNIYPSEKKTLAECEKRTPISDKDYKKDRKQLVKGPC